MRAFATACALVALTYWALTANSDDVLRSGAW